ncbi:MAG: aminoglycoside phosphotransferase family protein [Pyrinomonadaceae bacterium]
MSKSFTDSLPGELVTHITAQCGRVGEEWFAQLPNIIRTLEKRWSVTAFEPFSGIEFNYVAPAIHANGSHVVIKISPPFEQIEIFSEAAYLWNLDGKSAIRLMDVDYERRAILLEQAFPGKNLTELFTGCEVEALDPAIEILKEILEAPPTEASGITRLDQWFDGMRSFGSTEFPQAYATKALQIYDRLSLQSNRTFYIHGDFHPGNVVNATRLPYLAIDPKGIIGHLGYEIAVFLNNYHWWQEDRPDICKRLEHAVCRFSTAFDITPMELRQWAYAQMVLGAWWNFADAPALYNGEVVKADIWDV